MRKLVLPLLVIVLMIFGLLFVVSQKAVKSVDETSDQIPDSVVGADTVQFLFAVGQPGTTVTVRTDLGLLVISPDAILQGESTGEAKKGPDNAPGIGNEKERQYLVDLEGRVAFELRGDPGRANEVATLRVIRDGDLVKGPFEVKFIPISNPVEELDSICTIELEKTEHPNKDEGSTLNCYFVFKDKSGQRVDLSSVDAYLECRVMESSQAFLILGDCTDGNVVAYPLDKGLQTIVPVYNVPTSPISLTVTLQDENEADYISKSFEIHS